MFFYKKYKVYFKLKDQEGEFTDYAVVRAFSHSRAVEKVADKLHSDSITDYLFKVELKKKIGLL